MNQNLINKVLKVIVICSLFISGLILLLFKNSKSIILGYIFGTSINILSFYLINDSAIKLVRMEPSKAKRRAYFNYFLRFFIYFIVLLVSAIADYLNLIAAFLGLNMVKIAIYILGFFDKDFLKQG